MSIVISTFSAVSAEGVTLLVTFFCLKMQLLWKFPHSKQFCQLPSCPTWGRGRGQDRGQLQPERSHQRGGLLLASLPTSLPEKRKQMLKYLFLTSSFKKILCRNSIFLRSVSHCGQGTWLAISSLIAASASNQRTGRKTSGIFSKNNPILGLGRSWRIIWSRIKTWQESLWVQFIVKLVNDSFADTWIGIEVSICRVMLDECLQPLHLNI